MQADRYGTQEEQARHHVCWMSPLDASAARDAGSIGHDRRCATCCNFRASSSVCAVGVKVVAFTTDPACWCSKWSAALIVPEATHVA